MKSKGQELLEGFEAFILRYVALPAEPANQSIVLALWAIHTWMYERFTATPYLAITASTKRAGKTLAMDVLGSLCRNARTYATLRPLMLVRLIEAFEGRCTLFLDEAEKMSAAGLGDLRSIMTSGYRVGGKHGISAGSEFKDFRTYAPKCMALIGDVMDVVRDRAIVVHLQRGTPDQDFYAMRDEAVIDAENLIRTMREYFVTVPPRRSPAHLKEREQEIWTVLYSIADALALDKATQERLDRACSDLVSLKSLDARTYSNVADELELAEASAGVNALLDLATVFAQAGVEKLRTDTVIDKLQNIPTSGWRYYRGGLNADKLAALVSRFGVGPVLMSFGGKDKVTGKQNKARGYRRSEVDGAVAKHLPDAKVVA